MIMGYFLWSPHQPRKFPPMKMNVTTLTVWHAPAHAQAMNNGNDIANRVSLSVACTMEMQHFGYEQLLNF